MFTADDLLKFIRTVVPEARRVSGTIIQMPQQDTQDFIERIELEGATKVRKEWCPVSRKIAEHVFQDLETEGMYFMQVVLEGITYDFCVYANGQQIDEI